MLIETEDYTSALAYIEKVESSTLRTNANSVNQMMEINDSISENLYELKWLKAQVFVGLDRTDEAKSVLQEIYPILDLHSHEGNRPISRANIQAGATTSVVHLQSLPIGI